MASAVKIEKKVAVTHIKGIGQWPYQSKFSSRFCLGMVLFLGVFHLYAQIMGALKYRNDPSIFIDCITPLLLDCGCAAKLITCICYSKKIFKLTNRIKEDFRVWSNDEEIEILHEYAENGRKFVLVYTVFFYFVGVLYVSEPLVPKLIDTLFKNGTAPGEYPLPLHYGAIDMQKNYFYIIAYTYVGILAICSISIAWDVMFITIAAHGCGIFAAVGHRLKRAEVKENSTDNVINERASTAVYHHISTCIDRHNDAIEYGNLLEDACTWCFFIVVGVNMIMISITGLQIVTRTDSDESLLRFIGFVAVQLIHLYVETNIAQILMDRSTNISNDVFSGEWYRLPVKSQKLLGLIWVRANVPCKLTAGKMCDLNVETFAVILKTSMSYFTILSSMQ